MSLVQAVRDEVRAHAARGAREERSKARTLAMLEWLPDPLDEHRDPCHVTGSAIIVDDRDRVLLHRHKRLGIWLQPGGHLDPGESPADAAMREMLEETGIVGHHHADGPGDARLLHLDVHEGPRGHVHLDLRYLIVADGDAPLQPAPGESADVAWWHVDEVHEVADASLQAAIAAARHRLG